MSIRKLIAAVAIVWSFESAVHAAGVSAYLPLNLSPEIERQVERVLILGGRPVLTRPIAVATVVAALPRACRRETSLCRRVRAYIAQYQSTVAVTGASGELALAKNDAVAMPNQHGLRSNAKWRASAQALFQPEAHVLISAGGDVQKGDSTATGSGISLGWDSAQLDFGYRDRWFSPSMDSTMLPGTEAPTMPGVTLSSIRPLTRLGIEYQVFMERMGYSAHITNGTGTGFMAGHPRLGGVQVSIAPVDGWTIGASRVLQFGGGTRNSSLTSFANAFVNPGRYENTNVSLGQAQDFGNEEASITSAYTFPGKTPFEAYVEFAGEDTFHREAYRLGNTALTAGLHFPTLADRFDLTYETSEWQNNWYTHYIYQDGMTNDGYVLGNWGADWRTFNNDIVGRSNLLRLGWPTEHGDTIYVTYRTVQNASYGPIQYRRGHGVTLEYSQSNGPFTRGLQLDAGRDVYGGTYGRLAAFLRFAGDDEGGAGNWNTDADTDDEDDSNQVTGTERFVDVGASVGHLSRDRSDPTIPVITTNVSSPHLGVGVRRMTSTHSDFGVRAEFDDFHGGAMVALRALDYRFRAGRHLAFGAFFGFARYSGPTPAQGYYLGMGAQWRDLLPRWDLSFDLRDFDKLQRDKLLPGDVVTDKPDEFYHMTGYSLYLSRRF